MIKVENFKYLVIFISLLLVSNTIIHAQYISKQYSTKDGLCDDFVYNIFKDKRGVIWACTRSGLNLFDGKQWQSFNVSNGEIGKKYNKYIFTAMAEDDHENLFIATYDNGIYRYNYKIGKTEKVDLSSIGLSTNYNVLNLVFQHNYLYVFYTTGFLIYNVQQKKIVTHYQNQFQGISDATIANNKIFAVSFSGKIIEIDHLNIKVLDSCVFALNDIASWGGKFFVTTNKGLYKYADKLVKCVVTLNNAKNVSNEYYLSIIANKECKYLLSSNGGLYKVDTVINNRIYCSNTLEKNRDNANLFYTYANGYGNQIVIATTSGVQILTNHQPNVINYQLPANYQTEINCIEKIDTNNILIFTQNDIVEFNTTTGMFNKISFPEQKKQFVRATVPLNNGAILVSTNSNLLIYKNHKLFPYKNNIDSLPSDIYFNKIKLQKNADALFISTDNKKVFSVNTQQKTASRLKVLNAVVHDAVYFNSKLVYLGANGLCMLKDENNLIIDKSIVDGQLISNRKYCGLASNAKGILIFDSSFQIIKKIDELHHKKIDQIYSTSVDNNSTFWMATNIGIISIDSNLHLQLLPTYGINEKNNFSLYSCLTIDSSVFFGYKGNILQIQSNNFNSKMKPLCNIEMLQFHSKNDNTYFGKQLQYKMPYNQNNIEVKFAVVSDFPLPEQFLFFSINNAIPQSLDQHFLQLNALSPGEYNFLVFKDTTLYGKLNNLQFCIIILPPWWQTWWFRILLISICGAIIFFALRYYYSNQLKQKQLVIDKLQAANLERERISADLHDELGSTITGLKLLSNMAQKSDIQNPTLQLIQAQTAELNAKMRDVVWTNKVTNDYIDVLILYIKNYFNQQKEMLDLPIQIYIPTELPQIPISAIKRKDLFMACKEALNNCIKYAEATSIILHIEIENNLLKISIIDNGIGIIDKKTLGHGLKQMKQRIEIHNGLFIMNSSTKGTTIIFHIPI